MKIKDQNSVQALSAENMSQISGGWGWVPYAVGAAIIGDFLMGVNDGYHETCDQTCNSQP